MVNLGKSPCTGLTLATSGASSEAPSSEETSTADSSSSTDTSGATIEGPTPSFASAHPETTTLIIIGTIVTTVVIVVLARWLSQKLKQRKKNNTMHGYDLAVQTDWHSSNNGGNSMHSSYTHTIGASARAIRVTNNNNGRVLWV
jgi:hypothetical protein